MPPGFRSAAQALKAVKALNRCSQTSNKFFVSMSCIFPKKTSSADHSATSGQRMLLSGAKCCSSGRDSSWTGLAAAGHGVSFGALDLQSAWKCFDLIFDHVRSSSICTKRTDDGRCWSSSPLNPNGRIR